MGEFYGIGSGSDRMCECHPVDGGWVFLVVLIFYQFLAPRLINCRWSDWEGPQICGGVLNSSYNNLVPIFYVTFRVSKNRFVSRLA